MVDFQKIGEMIEKHFAEITPEEFRQNLQESCPEIFEPGAESWKSKYRYYPTREEIVKQAKERLVYLLGRSCAVETQAGKDFQENGSQPKYSIRMLKSFELGYGYDLVEVLAKYIEYTPIEFHRLVGIQRQEFSEEGYHLGAVVAAFVHKPCVILESEFRSIGKVEFRQQGKLLPGERVAIASDILTPGDNLIEAVNYLRGKPENIVVEDIFVLVSQAVGDRLQAIQQQLQQMQVNLHFLMDSKELVDALYQKKYITEAERQKIYKDRDFVGLTPDPQ